MIGQNCVLMSQEIRDVAKELNISDELTKHLVGVWQMQNNSNEVPQASNLSLLLEEIKPVNYDAQNSRNRYRRAFSPQILEKRIKHIASQFSTQVTMAHADMIEDIKDKIEIIESSEELSKRKKLRQLQVLNAKLSKLQNSESGRKYFLSTIKLSDLTDKIKSYYDVPEDLTIELYGEEQGKYIYQQQQLILEYFDHLFADSLHIIEGNENIRISTNGRILESSVDNVYEVEEEGEEEGSAGNEGWGIQVKFTDPRMTTLTAVKRVLGSIEKVDSNGSPILDDLGEVEFINSNTAYQTLLHELSKRVLAADDFSVLNSDGTYSFPALEEITLIYPWVQQIIDVLTDNPDLISAFYTSFRQAKTEVWVNVDGAPTSENTDMASRSFLKTATSNYINGNIINEEYSLYDKSGKINVGKAKERLASINSNSLEFKDVQSLLEGLGFEVPLYVLDSLYSTEGIDNVELLDKRISDFEQLIDLIKYTYSTIANLKTEDNLVESISTFYKNISEKIGIVDDFSTLVSIRVGNKSLQAYTYPSAIDVLVGNLTQDKDYKVRKYIEDNFLYTSWFRDSKGNIKSPWLEYLFESDNSEEYRKALQIIDVPLSKINGREVKYTNLNDFQLREVMISQYFAGGINRVFYNFPLFSDSPIIKFLRWNESNRLGGKDKLTSEQIKDTAINNLVSVVIQELERMSLVQQRKANDSTKIANFDTRGTAFCFLPKLNTHQSPSYGGRTLIEALHSTDINKLDFEVIKDYLTEVLDAEFNAAYQFKANGYSSDPNMNVLLDSIKGRNKHLRGYTHEDILTEYFYNNQFAQSQIIELTVTDLAYYKDMDDFQKRYKEVYASGKKLNTNSKYGKKTERAIYVADEEVTSYSYDTIKNNIDKNKSLPGSDADYLTKLANKYKDIVSTDGQSYRHIYSYRSILDMSGQWTPEQQYALESLERGEVNMANLLTVWQSIKPFVFTQLKTPTGTGDYLKVPHQHKNSEFAFLLFANNFLAKSERLQAINDFMIENNIDVLHFQSAVKHGASNVINLNNVKDSDIKEYLYKTFEDHKNDDYNTFIYEVPYENYHIAQNTPEHYFDTTSSFGSQLRTLIESDLPDNFETYINGKKYNKTELIKHYESLIIENLLDSAEKVTNDLGSIEKVQELLLSQVEGNPKYGRDILEALQLIKTKRPDGTIQTQFNLPLWDPSITEQLQEIFFSTFKNRITKQKINGGKATAVSSFGFSHELKVETDKEGNIKGIQCYLPAWSRKFFIKYLDESTGEVDIERIKEDAPELLKVIGYRIPTENKYSMFPLIVKGFMPLQSGGSIMLPVEAITMSGMDFDIDSVYLMFKNFDLADDGTVISVKYDPNKSYESNSKEARDNEIIDIIYSILINSGDKLFNCNNFDTIEKMANIIRVIDSPELIIKAFGESLNGNNLDTISNRLLNAKGDKIIKFVKNNKQERSPLNPETFIHYHQMNMVGGALIGMYANSSTNQAKTQKLDLRLTDDYTLNLNGTSYKDLSKVRSQDGKLISLIGAEFLAASVDNGKNPVLGDLKQNSNTARLTSLFIRLGVPIEDIALFFNVPSFNSLDLDKLNQYKDIKDLIGKLNSTLHPKVSSFNFDRKEWMKALLMNKLSIEDLYNAGLLQEYITTLYKTQVLRDSYENNVVPIISLNTSVHRADSPNGAVGRNLGLAMVQKLKVDKLQNVASNSYTINGLDNAIKNSYNENTSFNKSYYRKLFNNSSMPMIQAFHTLGIELAIDSANKWFLGANEAIQSSIAYLNSLTSEGYMSESNIRSYIFGLHEYFLKTNSLFGNSEENSLADKQRYYLEEFPKKFLKIKESYSEIAEIPIIKRMTVDKGNIILADSSNLAKTIRDYLGLGFEELLYLNSGNYNTDHIAIKLAVDLFKYSFYKDTFTFGPNNFGYMFNTAFKNSIVDYIQEERELLNKLNNLSDINNYTMQFIGRKFQKLGLYYMLDRDIYITKDSTDISVLKFRKSNIKEPPQYITYNHKLYEYTGEENEYGNPIYSLSLDAPIKSYDPSIKVENITELQDYKHLYKGVDNTEDNTPEPENIENIESTEDTPRETFNIFDIDTALEEKTIDDLFMQENPIDEKMDEEICKSTK